MKTVNIIGAGMAGTEAAHYLLNKGYNVNLYEMKPVKFSPAHKNSNFAELVCSNSFKSLEETSASGILKNELRMLNSLLMKVAEKTSVPSGNSLSVDRELFSAMATEELKKFNNLNVINEEITSFDTSLPTIIATGPLTTNGLSEFILNLLGEKQLYFFDALAPIVEADSIDFEYAFYANRYDKGDTKDFINCPLNKEEYLAFHTALVNAETVKLKDFENEKVFEGCMPVEVLAKRGVDALRFGPMKPVGLIDPKTGKRPYAVVQLRKENLQNLSYNLVGFQTNLTYGAQKEVLSLIPALKDAKFVRYGAMHRNSYINSPTALNKHFQMVKYSNIFVAGQLSGVEGYVESMSSGLMAAINLDQYLQGKPLIDFTPQTIMGGLSNYITTADKNNFQPMGSNLGLLQPLSEDIKDKKERNLIYYNRSKNRIEEILKIINN